MACGIFETNSTRSHCHQETTSTEVEAIVVERTSHHCAETSVRASNAFRLTVYPPATSATTARAANKERIDRIMVCLYSVVIKRQLQSRFYLLHVLQTGSPRKLSHQPVGDCWLEIVSGFTDAPTSSHRSLSGSR